jgi:predicted nucleic acid-binding protein
VPESVYIETTIVSYLTAWPTNDIIRQSHQLITRQWWNNARLRFSVYTSRIVQVEASAGDPVAARERLDALKDLPLLQISKEAEELASVIAGYTGLPSSKAADALHVAIAAVNGIDYLLTWNCTHLANGVLIPKIARACDSMSYVAPQIVTPEFLLETP